MQFSLRTFAWSFLALALVACGSEQQSELRPAKGGKFYGGEYRMNHTESIKTLDPVALNDAPSHHVVHQICDQLVDFDSNLSLQPELAERWEVSDDGLTYTYHLRKGVMFHDSEVFPNGKGRELTAEDVKYCFDRILDATAGSKGVSYFIDKVKGARVYFEQTQTGGSAPLASAKTPGDDSLARPTNIPAPAASDAPSTVAGGVTGFRVVDTYTFAIDLVEPFAAFKYYPALGMTYIYPREAVERYGADFFKNLVGTGAFVLERWDSDQELVVVRNPNYWRVDEAGNQLPFLDKIRFSFIKTEDGQLDEFRQGNLEESYRLPNSRFEDIVQDGKLTPEYSEFRLHRIEALSTQYYGMLTTSDVFSDPRIRQAFNLAVDRDRIINFVLKGQAAGPGVHGLVPPSMPKYNAQAINGYTYDLERARALLAEAGYPDGRGFPKIELQLNTGGGRNRDVAVAAQEMLSRGLGIDVGLRELEWGQHLDLIDRGDAPFFRLGWIADYPDPENFLNLFWSKNIPDEGPSPINSTRFRSSEFDRLFEQALRTQDDAERMALYQQAEQIAVNEAPMLWIFHDMDYRLVQPYVRDYSSNPMDRRDLTWTWFDNAADPS